MKHTLKTALAGMILSALALTACEREEPFQDAQNNSTALSQGTQTPGIWSTNIEDIFAVASTLEEESWRELNLSEQNGDFPITRVRRSPMLKPGTMGYTTDGKTLTPAGLIQVVVVEGETRDGGRALFAIDANNMAGWYDSPEGRMFFQNTSFDNPERPKGEVMVVSELEALALAPQDAGGCALETPKGLQSEQAPADNAMPEANCWKLQVLMHGDHQYYGTVAHYNLNNANFGMVAYAVWSDPAFAAINMDLVVSHITITTTYTNFTTDTYQLKHIVRNFWAQFPTQRDVVLYVSGKNLTSAYWGPGALGEAFNLNMVCAQPVNSVAVAEWTRSSVNGHTQAVCNGRIGAHEIGHLLGAAHTNCQLMTGSSLFATTCASSNFNSTSTYQMNWHIWFNHGCLHQAGCN